MKLKLNCYMLMHFGMLPMLMLKLLLCYYFVLHQFDKYLH